MDQNLIFLIIVGMALVTFLPRLLPAWFLARRKLPAVVVTWLRYVPAAVLAAMLFPALLLDGQQLNIQPANLFLLAALPTFFVAWKTKSLFGAVMVGMLLVALGRLILAA
jgi:branched-subunit amino acid transport protein